MPWSKVTSKAALPSPSRLTCLCSILSRSGWGGICGRGLLAEVRTAYAYRDLTDNEWHWALDFVVNGGMPLTPTRSTNGLYWWMVDMLLRTGT